MCVPVPILPSFLYVYLLPPFFVDTCVYLPLRPFYGCTCPPGSPHPLKTLCVLSHSLSLYAQDPVCNQRRANAMVLEPD